jgi:membrane protease subunit HflK
MPWNNQGGGGPWKPTNPGPWGQGSGGGQGGGGSGGPPDLEEFIRRSQEKFKQAMPGGSRSASTSASAPIPARRSPA